MDTHHHDDAPGFDLVQATRSVQPFAVLSPRSAHPRAVMIDSSDRVLRRASPSLGDPFALGPLRILRRQPVLAKPISDWLPARAACRHVLA